MAEKKQPAANPQPKTTKTVVNTAAQKIAKDIFRQSQAIKEVHITADGTAFYTHNDAFNYARSLRNHGIVSLKREDVND